MISTFYPPYNFGGDGIFIYRLSNMLAENGHTVDIVHCTDAYHILEKKAPKIKYKHHDNVNVHSLKSTFGGISPLLTQQTGRSFLKKKKIKELIEEKEFDVINYHNISLIGLEVVKLGNAIKIYTTHEHWLVCPMHVLWKYDNSVCEKKDCIKCQLVGKRPVQWWRFSNYRDKAMQHIDRIISPSLFTIEKHRAYGFDGPFVHLPNFLPIPEDVPEKPIAQLLPTKKPYFLYVGRLEKIKGPQTLIPVFKKYRNADLVIAGDGILEQELRTTANDAPNIHFLGRVEYKQLLNWYKNTSAVIVPSLCYEVFPLVILEAFSQKTPVITRNRGSLIEVVKQSNGGFNYNNDDELINCLEKIINNPNHQKKLGENGYNCYKVNWTTEIYMQRYFNLIKEITEEKRKAAQIK